VTVKGTVVGPDGVPADVAVIVSPTYMPREEYHYQGVPLYAQNGRFELPGCDPDRAVPVLFCDPKRKHGARVELSGACEPTVRLAACRSARVRFVDAEGKPAAGTRIALDVVVHPRGVPAGLPERFLHTGYTVPAATLSGGRFATAGKGPGEVVFPCLIPGATYLIQVDEGRGMVVKKQFTVQADEDSQLPDILVRRPPGRAPAP
jgi:hypothetical protein